LGLEYRLLAIYSRDAGQRSAKLAFDVGQGTQDVGFSNETTILFNAAASRKIPIRVRDENGERMMASFIFKDTLGRIYPNPAKRLAPDFFFQPQIYRADGESSSLPSGSYNVTVTGGPEYVTETRSFKVDDAAPGTVHIEADAAAYLDEQPEAKFHGLAYDQKPYWNLERARIAGTRKVPVEVIVNGIPAARQEIVADGTEQKLRFDVRIQRSSWVALRVLPSSHTNPIWVTVDGKPQQASCRGDVSFCV
jgi:hypothetical protein